MLIPTLPRIGARSRPETEILVSRDDPSLFLFYFLSLLLCDPISLDNGIVSTSGTCGFVTSCGPLFRSSASASRATAAPRQMTVSEGTEGTPTLTSLYVQKYKSYISGRRCCCCCCQAASSRNISPLVPLLLMCQKLASLLLLLITACVIVPLSSSS